MTVYRNSWFAVERELRDHAEWRTARPDGSLTISGHGYAIHVYRVGADEHIDLDDIRLDGDGSSTTKRLIAQANGQLAFRFTSTGPRVERELRNLVVAHAGNPDDGCCAVWIGAPLSAEEMTV
jgi:hypothetical protein